MKIIGITGGVGAGKSTVLGLLKEICRCEIIMADDVAKELMAGGGILSQDAIRLFGSDAYLSDNSLNTRHIAEIMYGNPAVKKEWTSLVHPAVNKEIARRIERASKKPECEYVFIEAALLIENNYDKICDEIWYIYADKEERIKRLKESRGYSREKSESIIKNQLGHEDFMQKCDFVIDNGISVDDTKKQLENKLEE